MTLPAVVHRPPLQPAPAPGRAVADARDDEESGVPAALCYALCHGSVDEFVRAADGLVGGPVALLDRAGEVVGVSRDGARSPSRARVLVLQDAGDVLGSLELPPGEAWSASRDRLLHDLGVALLRRRSGLGEIRRLRHRVSLLSWLSAHPELGPADSANAGAASAACRPVVAAASRPVGGFVGVARRLAAACATEPLLAGVDLVPADDSLVGMYESAAGTSPRQHSRAWSRALAAARIPALTLAVGRPSAPGAALQDSYLQARRLAVLQRDRCDYLDLPDVAVTDELGPMADVLASVSAGQVVPFIERVLGGLVADGRFGGQLVETLFAYLTTGGSPQEAGRLLHLHPSSVKYRIRAIRELLGGRLDDPARRFDLELAVRLYLAARELGERCAVPG